MISIQIEMNGETNATNFNNETVACPIDCCCNQNGKCFISPIVLSQCPCINTGICIKSNYIPAIIGASIGTGVILIIMGILLIYWCCRRPANVNPTAPNRNPNPNSSNQQSQSQQQGPSITNQTSQNSNWHRNHRQYPHPSAILYNFHRGTNPNATTDGIINSSDNNNNSGMNLQTYPFSSPVQFFVHPNRQDKGKAQDKGQDEVKGREYRQNVFESQIRQNIKVEKFQDNSQIQVDQ